jgi:hypothetical protein
MFTSQGSLFPLHAPLQSTESKRLPGVAVRTTLLLASNVAAHVDPQLIPAGVLLTVPSPEACTLSWNEVSWVLPELVEFVPPPPQALMMTMSSNRNVIEPSDLTHDIGRPPENQPYTSGTRL